MPAHCGHDALLATHRACSPGSMTAVCCAAYHRLRAIPHTGYHLPVPVSTVTRALPQPAHSTLPPSNTDITARHPDCRPPPPLLVHCGYGLAALVGGLIYALRCQHSCLHAYTGVHPLPVHTASYDLATFLLFCLVCAMPSPHTPLPYLLPCLLPCHCCIPLLLTTHSPHPPLCCATCPPLPTPTPFPTHACLPHVPLLHPSHILPHICASG